MLVEGPKLKTGKRTHGWMGTLRGHKAHPFEWMAEKLILVVSLSAILMIFLIFLFIGREALPIIFGRMNSAGRQEVIPPDQIDKIDSERLRVYLELTPKEFADMDRETKIALMEVHVDAAKEA